MTVPNAREDGLTVPSAKYAELSTTQRIVVAAFVVVNGNDEADSTATGLLLTLRPAAARVSVTLKAGYRFQDEDDGAYGGVQTGYGF